MVVGAEDVEEELLDRHFALGSVAVPTTANDVAFDVTFAVIESVDAVVEIGRFVDGSCVFAVLSSRSFAAEKARFFGEFFEAFWRQIKSQLTFSCFDLVLTKEMSEILLSTPLVGVRHLEGSFVSCLRLSSILGKLRSTPTRSGRLYQVQGLVSRQ